MFGRIAYLASVVSLGVLALATSALGSFAGTNGVILISGVSSTDHLAHLWTVAPLDGATARDLGPVAKDLVAAQFTPDGKHIVFLRRISEDGVGSLDVMNLDGSRKRVIIRRSGMSAFGVSPDGSSVAYCTRPPKDSSCQMLWVVPLHGGHSRLLTYDWQGLGWGVLPWTREDEMYSVFDRVHCATALCTFDPSTGTYTANRFDMRGIDNCCPPIFSPDGRRLAYWTPIGPAGVRVYTPYGAFLHNIRQTALGPAAFSPDGTKVLLNEDRGPGWLSLAVFNFHTATLRELKVNIPSLDPNAASGIVTSAVDWQARPE